MFGTPDLINLFPNSLISLYTYISENINIQVIFISFSFLICYLAAPWSTLGHCQGDRFVPVIITALYYLIFDLEVIGSLIARLVPV